MKEKKYGLKPLVPFLLTILFVISGLLLVRQLLTFAEDDPANIPDGTDLSFNILVAGSQKNHSYMQQVFKGAEEAGLQYGSAVTFYEPQKGNPADELQKIFAYAAGIDATGIIVYTEKLDAPIELPRHHDGSPIPVITLGNYNPGLQQVSFIGLNYSELGRIMAKETIAMLKNGGTAFLLDFNQDYNQNYSMLMNSLMGAINQNDGISIDHFVFNLESTFSKEDAFRQQMASQASLDVVISFSEANTVLAAQTITDLNRAGKARVIGFGDSSDSRNYYEKGIITELIAINTIEIGRKAVNELFEYVNTGFANSYVIADVEVLKGGR